VRCRGSATKAESMILPDSPKREHKSRRVTMPHTSLAIAIETRGTVALVDGDGSSSLHMSSLHNAAILEFANSCRVRALR
jgi:hypothetical protein